MTTVQEIEKAIEHLPQDKLAEFRQWFESYEAAAWDQQFERDVMAGKLDSLAKQALCDLQSKRCSEL